MKSNEFHTLKSLLMFHDLAYKSNEELKLKEGEGLNSKTYFLSQIIFLRILLPSCIHVMINGRKYKGDQAGVKDHYLQK